MTKLKQTSLTHCLLHNDIKNLAHRLTILSVWIVNVLGVHSVLSFMIDFQLNFATHKLCVDYVALFKSLSGPNIVARVDEFSYQ